jgi:hypothetical protein
MFAERKAYPLDAERIALLQEFVQGVMQSSTFLGWASA